MTSAVTVEFWAKRRTISSTYQVLVAKPGNGQSKYENYAVWLGTSNRYTAYFGDGSTWVAVQTPAVTDTNWHHVVATNDGSTVKIYLDGVLKQSTSTTMRLTANTQPLIGGRRAFVAANAIQQPQDMQHHRVDGLGEFGSHGGENDE